jgi:Domain of unknown function (DUF4157)
MAGASPIFAESDHWPVKSVRDQDSSLLHAPTEDAPGSSLDEGVRQEAERSFHRDFSAVRVHAGPLAQQMNAAIGARAFTIGSHLFFAHGEYQPGTSAGRRLIAHEFAHVTQNADASAHPAIISQPGAPAEAEADRAAFAMERGSHPLIASRPGGAIGVPLAPRAAQAALAPPSSPEHTGPPEPY